jgi:hypothetical protein
MQLPKKRRGLENSAQKNFLPCKLQTDALHDTYSEEILLAKKPPPLQPAKRAGHSFN